MKHRAICVGLMLLLVAGGGWANNPSPYSDEIGSNPPFPYPGKGDPPEEPCTECDKASPFFPGTGGFSHQEVDLEISGAGFPLRLERIYRSQSNVDGYFGRKWRLGFESRILSARRGPLGGGSDYKIVVMPGGTVRRYRCIQAPAAGEDCSLFENPYGVLDDLQREDDNDQDSGNDRYFINEVGSGLTYRFDEFGNLGRIEDRRGRYIEFHYGPDPERYLDFVKNDAEDRIDFTVTDGRIWGASDSGGRTVSYDYDQDTGDLIGFTDVLGHDWSYEYGDASLPHYLTQISRVLNRQSTAIQQVTYYNPDWFEQLLGRGTGSATFGGACSRVTGDGLEAFRRYIGAVRSYLEDGRAVDVGPFQIAQNTEGQCFAKLKNEAGNWVTTKTVGGHSYELEVDPTTLKVVSRKVPLGNNQYAVTRYNLPAKGSLEDRDGRITATVDPSGRQTRMEYLFSDDSDPDSDADDNTGLVTRIERAAAEGGSEFEATDLEYQPVGPFFDLTRTATTGKPSSETTFEYAAEGDLFATSQTTERVHRDGDSCTPGPCRLLESRSIYSSSARPGGSPVFELVESRDSQDVATTYQYETDGDLASVVLPQNYDGDLQVARLVRYEYDALHRVTRMVDPTGIATCYEYDALGRTTTIRAPDPQAPGNCNSSRFVTTVTYDDVPEPPGYSGNLSVDWSRMTTTDPNGQSTQQVSDQFGRLRMAFDADGNATSYEYDGGLLTAAIDANGNRTSYGYDEADRLVTITDATRGDAAVTRFTYDPDGQLHSTIGPDAVTRTQIYDLRGRVRTETVDTPGGAHYERGFVYDPVTSELTSVTDGLAEDLSGGPVVVDWEYDGFGRLTRTSRHGVAMEIDYLGLSQVAARRVIKAFGEGFDEIETDYSYYPDGSVRSSIPPFATTVGQGYYYDPAGRLELVILADAIPLPPRGSTTLDLNMIRENLFDEAGRLAAIEHFNTQAVNPNPLVRTCIRREEFDYDAPDGSSGRLGLLTAQRSMDNRTGYVAEERTYRYDDLYRLVSTAYGPWQPPVDAGETRFQDLSQATESFTYDSIGNRLTRSVASPIGSATTSYQYLINSVGGNSQLLTGSVSTSITGSSSVSYVHDAAGRLVSRAQTNTLGPALSWEYDWDPIGRLHSIRETGGRTLATYRYDFDGFRFLAEESAFPNLVMQRANLASADGDTFYALFPPGGQDEFWINVPGIDNHAAYSQFGFAKFLLTDHLGTVVADSYRGEVFELRRYTPFGELASRWKEALSSQPDQPYGFTGREAALQLPIGLNGETLPADRLLPRLTYHRARYYDPEIGRFISPDPGGLRDGPNLWAYAQNVPTMLRDPGGMEACAIFAVDETDGIHGWIEWPGGSVDFALARATGADILASMCVPQESVVGFNAHFRDESKKRKRETYFLDGHRQDTLECCGEYYDCMERVARAWRSNKYGYSLLYRSCRTFVAEALKACGLSTIPPGLDPAPYAYSSMDPYIH